MCFPSGAARCLFQSLLVSLLGQGHPVCFRWGSRNLGIVSLTRYIEQYPGAAPPRLQIADLPKTPMSRRLFSVVILYYDLRFNISRQPVSGLNSSSINPRLCTRASAEGVD